MEARRRGAVPCFSPIHPYLTSSDPHTQRRVLLRTYIHTARSPAFGAVLCIER
ncbi:hypothetical protein JMJ77_0015038 [Colletotrichum scovillei]|uniref:Uncharacterized protein n=1 Tax=Colletotrichum scovillei TaxID=1209932 RepID=A0A9P7R3E5_9PEZI|nr:hypothetical protein JMJ77_0015038 [Colletotrichum scovillei]KAG7056662.1 hypothetical protein JMJ78_0000454 [Colletotrichum scovillei]KAG7066591.1 hypothetical protein JMJ76_0000447 [Colletotrichum scovillei]